MSRVPPGFAALLASLAGCAPGAAEPAAVAPSPTLAPQNGPPAWAVVSATPRPAVPGVSQGTIAPEAPSSSGTPSMTGSSAPPDEPPSTPVTASAQAFRQSSMRLDGTGFHKLSVSATGSCEGDCALGTNTIVSIVAKGDKLSACLVTTSKLTATIALRLQIDHVGRVVSITRLAATSHVKEGICVLGVFSRTQFPPGSDPSATSTIVLDVDASFTPRAP